MKVESEWNRLEDNFMLKRFNRLYHHFIFEEGAYYKNQRIHFQTETFLIYQPFSLLKIATKNTSGMFKILKIEWNWKLWRKNKTITHF